MRRKTKKNQRGITLVALVLTVIVLLILLGVTADIAVDGKLFDSARTAVNDTNDKVAGFEDSADRYGSQLDQELNAYEEESRESLKGKRVGVNTKYTDTNGKTAIIPEGFTLSGIASEQTVARGLVIYDIPATEVSSIDWKKPDSVKTKYNQFVWIPVEVTESDTSTSVSAFSYSVSSGAEPNESYGYSGEVEDYENAVKSVYKYGGFYIGRYEAGTTMPRSSGDQRGTTPLVIVQDAYPYNHVQWGTSSNTIGNVGAVSLSKNLYAGKTGYGVISELQSGATWKCVLEFLDLSLTGNADASTWGNYYSSNFNVSRGKYCIEGTWTSISGTYAKPSNTRVLLTTGASDNFCSKNIYDIAGNVAEWTKAYYTGDSGTKIDTDRVFYGGAYGDGLSGEKTYWDLDREPFINNLNALRCCLDSFLYRF